MESLGSIGKAFGVFAHRGYHGVNGVSENSLGSFKAAIDLGADAIELDVHRTRDGVLVLHHDWRTWTSRSCRRSRTGSRSRR
jgi:glycerophosphoryl diester phosphodiesterase